MDELRETIARAIWDGGLIREVDPTPWADLSPWTRQHILTEADAVIESLGLREERRENGRNLHDGPDAEHWTEHRYVTTWKRVP